MTNTTHPPAPLKPANPAVEAYRVKFEEDLYPYIAVGAMDRETAHFLSTHPKVRRKWLDDLNFLREEEKKLDF